jgi:protein Tex
MPLAPIEQRIATLLNARPAQVIAAVSLLDEGATVPFIARYRKEVTGGLDDTQLRTLDERLTYLRELETRRAAILESIASQGKLDAPLKARIEAAEDKATLEDLYLPYKPKRRTKAQIAHEAGLAPLADALLADPSLEPEATAQGYLRDAFTNAEGDANPGVPDVKAALDGARQILMERFAEDAALIGRLRAQVQAQGLLVSSVVAGKEQEGAKFADYFRYDEPLKQVPSHRALALFRGRREEVLSVELRLPEESEGRPAWNAPHNTCEQMIATHAGIAARGRAADKWLMDTARWAWRVKLSLHLDTELMSELRERAEEEAIRVFATNLKDLLLAAPAGPKAVLGLDPGLRTGVKVAVVDATGKLLETTTIFPHEPRRDWDGALATLTALVARHQVELIAIGNGTASRETDKLAIDLISRCKGQRIAKVMVSEAGASVYSASALAAQEFPSLDVSLRGAVSIARRLQDPLAELVKIEPKAIGVGQYQHDVNQTRLARSLDAVIEDCVNAVGVDVNTASPALLSRVSGLSSGIANNIVHHRDTHGRFVSRAALRAVPRLGDKAFEQAAGFLRVMDGENPLDASAVHPEAYPLVEKILADIKREVRQVIGDGALTKSLNAAKYADDRFGVPTVKDILGELEKPGRDPRPEFKTASFAEGVHQISDLKPGMVLEGVVSNVAAFGAFVDIGVHQDGLVHISALSDKFVRDPHAVVKAGQVVKVKVLEVDAKRNRIALTLRLSDALPSGTSDDRRGGSGERRGAPGNSGNSPKMPTHQRSSGSARVEPATQGAMAAAFAKLKK